MIPALSRSLLRTQTDRRLAELVAGGSEGAYEVLVERHRRELLRHCRRLLLGEAAAEDAVQAALLDAWRALSSGAEVAEPRAWLHAIVHRVAIRALADSGYAHAELHDSLRGADAPEEDVERRIAVRRALAGLAALPLEQREALLRTAVEGESHAAAAAAMGVGEGALRGLVYRGRQTLRAGATALTPGPLLAWAIQGGDRAASPLGERIAELVAGAGTATGGALLAKAGATVAVTGALAGAGVVVHHARDPVIRESTPPSGTGQASRAASPPRRAATTPVAEAAAANGAVSGTPESAMAKGRRRSTPTGRSGPGTKRDEKARTRPGRSEPAGRDEERAGRDDAPSRQDAETTRPGSGNAGGGGSGGRRGGSAGRSRPRPSDAPSAGDDERGDRSRREDGGRTVPQRTRTPGRDRTSRDPDSGGVRDGKDAPKATATPD